MDATALADRGFVDAPSLIPDELTGLGERLPGDTAPGSLAPEVSAGSALEAQFGVEFPTGASGGTWFGEGRLDLPGAPPTADLDAERDPAIDPGYDLEALAGNAPLDGRTPDAFDGVGRDSGATGPAEPGGVASDGAGDLTTGKTSGSVAEYIGSFFGISTSAEKAYEKADAAAAAAAAANAETLTTPGVGYSDSDGVSSSVKTPTGAAAEALSPLASFFSSVGGKSEAGKQMKFVGGDVPAGGHQDGLPPDHPDYVAPPTEVPPGSAATDAINRSLLQGLGGQRGGDVDPADDTQGDTGEVEGGFDPYDTVVDPGEDGFMSTRDVDSSLLGGPMDAIAPELAEE